MAFPKKVTLTTLSFSANKDDEVELKEGEKIEIINPFKNIRELLEYTKWLATEAPLKSLKNLQLTVMKITIQETHYFTYSEALNHKMDGIIVSYKIYLQKMIFSLQLSLMEFIKTWNGMRLVSVN